MKKCLMRTWWGEQESGPFQVQVLGEEVMKEVFEDRMKR
jgi:hypothetical protein